MSEGVTRAEMCRKMRLRQGPTDVCSVAISFHRQAPHLVASRRTPFQSKSFAYDGSKEELANHEATCSLHHWPLSSWSL